MTVDPSVVPGFLLLLAEFAALAAVGYVVARVALRQDNEPMALAQGLVIGLALWGLITNVVLYAVPGLAGAAVGWGVVLALSAVLAWRAPQPIGPRPRVAAVFAAVVVALLWVSTAARQLGSIPDPMIHLGLAASIRAGGFPPELPWGPGAPAPYHYGPSLLVGLLAPPTGTDLAFVSELLGVYAWIGFALVVVTALARYGSWPIALLLAPLLLTSGLWTFASAGAGILQLPIPAGLPDAGLRASLAGVYWPPVELSPTARFVEIVPDISKPAFTLGYALAFVVLERAARSDCASWLATATLAGLVGFLGLLSTTLVPVVMLAWAGLAVADGVRARRDGAAVRTVLRSGLGLALAALLLLLDWTVFTRILGGAGPPGLSLAWNPDPRQWEALGTFDVHAGGVALAGMGPLVVAGLAVALAWRDRLVVALAAGAGLLVLAWLVVSYPTYPLDLNRLAGHARNLALLALLPALGIRLASLPSVRWRYVIGALLIGLIVWPTAAAQVRSLGLAVGHGVQLANANSVEPKLNARGDLVPPRRFQLPVMSDRVADHIRDHTAPDARVLTSEPPFWTVFFATGRPSNAGFAEITHLIYYLGPAYWDAHRYLEPRAMRRLGLDYVHATDTWIAGLPERAQGWLADPRLFELLVRDGAEALYRVRPAFLALDVAPHAESFEALRSAPAATVAYLAPQTLWLDRLRVASVLSHVRLVGVIDTEPLHLRSSAPWTVEPLGERVPDLVVLPASIEPWTWMFPPGARRPVWQNERIAVYAPHGALASMAPPPPARQEPPVTVRISDAGIDGGRVTFTAAFQEHAPERWTGQDWVVVRVDGGPWGLPTRFQGQGRGPEIAKWFGGLISSGTATSSHTYELDVPAASLAVRDAAGALAPLAASDGELGVGAWVLAVRLRHEYQPEFWRETAFIPVLMIAVSDAGAVSYAVFDEVLDGESLPGSPVTP
ncbi:MAG: hypothetical protein OXU21_03140 [Chloroflexota bacterium]|nr:hypothetical protein [Chloroflexota bacterium]